MFLFLLVAIFPSISWRIVRWERRLTAPRRAVAARGPRKIAALVALLFCVSPFAMAQENAPPQSQINARIDDGQRTVLPGYRHPLATVSNDIGKVPGAEPMIAMAIYVKRTAKQSADLNELLTEQLDPNSINYHRWLTAAQFGERFGADPQDLAKISEWLVSQGFAVLPATHSRSWIDFNGNTAQAEAAFRTEIHRYQTTDRTFYANASDPSVPSAFSAMVQEIQGLDNYIEKRPGPKSVRGKLPLIANNLPVGGRPLLDSGSNYALCAGDAQIIYDSLPLYSLNPAINGAGQTVATAGNFAVVPDSFNAFRSYCGLPAQAVDIIAMPGTPSPWTGGTSDEALLDFEWIGALAPGAQVVYVYGTDVISALSYILDNDLAQVVSFSWGTCESGWGDTVGELANAQGITIMASSGDSGNAGCRLDPSTSPHVTSVGGTSFTGLSSAYWGQNRSNNSSALGYGTALSSAQLNATSLVAGTFVYSPAAGTTPVAGTDALSTTFTPTDATDYTTATATVALTVESFTVSLIGLPTQTATPGEATTFNFTVSPVGLTTLPTAVTFTVSALPPDSSYTFTPAVIPAGSASTGVKLVIETSNSYSARNTEPQGYAPGRAGGTSATATPLAALLSSTPPAQRWPFPFAPFSFGLAACVVFLGFKRFRVLRLGFAMVALAGLTMGLAGCSGGFARSPTTAAGSYVITVTATSGDQHVSTTFTLVVQR